MSVHEKWSVYGCLSWWKNEEDEEAHGCWHVITTCEKRKKYGDSWVLEVCCISVKKKDICVVWSEDLLVLSWCEWVCVHEHVERGLLWSVGRIEGERLLHGATSCSHERYDFYHFPLSLSSWESEVISEKWKHDGELKVGIVKGVKRRYW